MSIVDDLLRQLGYNTLRTIGEGTFCTVKMASSSKYNRKVGIKVIDKKTAPSNYTTKFLPQELDILRKIRHPNIIQTYELIHISNGLELIVMELCLTDLQQLMQEVGRLSEEKARYLFKQITKAIKYLHKHNVAHRDLKCGNILITSDHTVKITDFSFGIIFPNGSELCSTYCGTPGYSSPEVEQQIPYDPRKSDIWSLGIILYVMVIGKLPFDECYISALPKTEKIKVIFPEEIEVDAKCKSLIKDLLQYNPHDRPDISTLMKNDWIQAA